MLSHGIIFDDEGQPCFGATLSHIRWLKELISMSLQVQVLDGNKYLSVQKKILLVKSEKGIFVDSIKLIQ